MDEQHSAEPVFSKTIADLDYPLVVVTAVSGEGRAGCLAGFTTQASIEPPRFIVCISKENRTLRVARRADAIAVHLLPEDRDDLAELFGGETGDEVDKFERCDWRPGPRDVPVIAGCPSWFAAEVVERSDCGDHEAFLLAPFAAERSGAANPYRVSRGARIDPGHDA